jgi:hypothetical protein
MKSGNDEQIEVQVLNVAGILRHTRCGHLSITSSVYTSLSSHFTNSLFVLAF